MSNDDLIALLVATPFRERRFWNPAVGDILAGMLIEDRQKEHQGKLVRAIVILDEHNVEWEYWLTTSYIKSEWKRLEPAIGDRVALRRDPDVPGKGFFRKIITPVVIRASGKDGKAA